MSDEKEQVAPEEPKPFYSDNPAFDLPEATNNLTEGEPDSTGPAQEGGLNPLSVPATDSGSGSFDPNAHTVDEVNEHLEGADDAEVERVLNAERDGKGRVGVLGDDA